MQHMGSLSDSRQFLRTSPPSVSYAIPLLSGDTYFMTVARILDTTGNMRRLFDEDMQQ